MEGLYFYWFAWIGWTWVTFFMAKKNPARTTIAVWMLLAMIAAPYKMTISTITIHGSGVVSSLFLLLETRRMNRKGFLFLFLSSFIIMLAHASFLLFEMLDPVWVILDRRILLAGSIVYLAILLQKSGYNRGLVLIAGSLQGEVLYAAVLERYGFPYFVASLEYLDVLIISLAVLFVWSKLESVIAALSGSIITHIEGEEHKPS